MRLASVLALALLAPLALSVGCPGENPEGPHALPPLGDGKTDNYVSDTAREYVLSGEAHATLPADYATQTPEEQTATLERLVAARLGTVGRAVKSHIQQVERDANAELPEGANEFFTYFKRNNASAEAATVVDATRAVFPFEMEFIGHNLLMSKVAPESNDPRTFVVEVKDWGEATGEQVTVTIAGSESRDAFPKYDELFADGIFDIAIHFGGDYNTERYDLETAKWTVEYLLEGGWTHPSATSLESLTLESEPFTRTLKVEGKEVAVNVYVYTAEMDGGGDQGVLSQAMAASFAARDIVVYSGHAGEGAGFLLDYHPRYELRASAFADLPLASKYQIFIFDGCNSYRSYVDDMMKNPAKTFDNVDMVTTVNTTPFSAGYQLIHELLFWFTITEEDGTHYPLSWLTLLRGVNKDFWDVHYGVHGIDQDPQLNPNGGQTMMCSGCETDADCGAGGNYCLAYSEGAACGVACTTDAACGQGYRCARLWDDPELFYLPKQCIRRDQVCE
ncbi:MAG: hypothetical protein P1V51_00715 [Deltaproteobacteria bacterium]|nr:hypothetical protein [Deltaproteobacteria bacterium]